MSKKKPASTMTRKSKGAREDRTGSAHRSSSIEDEAGALTVQQ